VHLGVFEILTRPSVAFLLALLRLCPLQRDCSIELEQLHALEIFQEFPNEPFILLLFIMF
jgi:hypothetical protein